MRRLPAIMLFAAGLGTGAVGAGVVGGRLGARVEARADENREIAGADRPAPVAEATLDRTAGGEGEDIRAKIRASIAAALAEQRRGQKLDLLLDELEAQARKQGKVTALEVATGLAALEAAYPTDPEPGAAFARRMERLSRELEARAEPAAAATADVGVIAHLQAIGATPSGPERDRMTRAALAAIDRLPPEEQEQALAGLDRATARGLATAPVRDPEGVLAELRQTRNPETRRALVDELLGAVAGLPLEEQERRLRELDAVTSGPVPAN